MGFSPCADVQCDIDVNEKIHHSRSPLISSRKAKTSMRPNCVSVNSGNSSSGGVGAFWISSMRASMAWARSMTTCGRLCGVCVSIASSGTVTTSRIFSCLSRKGGMKSSLPAVCSPCPNRRTRRPFHLAGRVPMVHRGHPVRRLIVQHALMRGDSGGVRRPPGMRYGWMSRQGFICTHCASRAWFTK